jgi:hypothetical protein
VAYHLLFVGVLGSFNGQMVYGYFIKRTQKAELFLEPEIEK